MEYKLSYEFCHLVKNDKKWFNIAKYLIRILALILIISLVTRNTIIEGLFIPKPLFYVLLISLKVTIISLYTTGLKYRLVGKLIFSEENIEYSSESKSAKFKINDIGLIDIRETGKNFWTRKKYYIIAFENFDDELFKIYIDSVQNETDFKNLIERWLKNNIKVKTFNISGKKT